MRKHALTVVAILPLLFSFSHAAQSNPVDPSGNAWIFSSEDGGTTSYLGVDIADVTGERLNALKLKEEKGVEVTMVDQDAPAGKAGIKEHDVIMTLNGNVLESAAQLRRMIHETPAGRVITLGLSRDGQPLSVKVQLGDRHKEFSYVGPKSKDFQFVVPDIHVPEIDIPSFTMVTTVTARSGLMVENITPQLAEFFGVKNGNGVLVRSVEKGSRAEKAGFRAGDVIVKINDQPIHEISDFTNAVHTRSGNSISVGVVRDKKEQNLNLSVPERKDSSDLYDEESGDNDALDADDDTELGEVQQEVADLQPEMELAKEYARESAEQARESLCQAQKEVRQESRKQQREMRKQQEELKKEMQRMSEQLRRTLADI